MSSTKYQIRIICVNLIDSILNSQELLELVPKKAVSVNLIHCHYIIVCTCGQTPQRQKAGQVQEGEDEEVYIGLTNFKACQLLEVDETVEGDPE